MEQEAWERSEGEISHECSGRGMEGASEEEIFIKNI